jgi:nicotinamidase/pyrazinamidase
MKQPVIFWDVDTQHDFMDHTGKLYVTDAEQIKPALKRLTDYARGRQIRIVASADDHRAGDRELSATPDFRETFPEHCMHGTPGAAKIAETTLVAPLVIEPEALSHETLARTLYSHDGDVLLRKHWFDVFTNANTETLLDAWDPTEIVVYGVALDVCDKYAIEGFLEHGVPEIHLVLDATKAIHPEEAAPLVERWKAEGVHLVTTDDVLNGRVI